MAECLLEQSKLGDEPRGWRPSVVSCREAEGALDAVERVYVGGWPHVRLSRKQFAELMAADCLRARKNGKKILPKLAFSMNGHALSLTGTDPRFRAAMKAADYIQADGQSIVFASKWLASQSLPERIATTDFFHDAAKVAENLGLRFFLLGASEEVNERAAAEASRLYPRLRIVGRRNGYFAEVEESAICREILSSKADVLWLGVGKPKEQLFCVRNRMRLLGLGWIKTCGGLFDFLGGHNVRAPLWMQRSGLEWLHRLTVDPQRLLWRYAKTNVHALALLLKDCQRAKNKGKKK
jgi:N-acetylglucosaminyldiphosphoundecaprenol N-acetyl-beta-D-mannosaminyltransferase